MFPHTDEEQQLYNAIIWEHRKSYEIFVKIPGAAARQAVCQLQPNSEAEQQGLLSLPKESLGSPKPLCSRGSPQQVPPEHSPALLTTPVLNCHIISQRSLLFLAQGENMQQKDVFYWRAGRRICITEQPFHKAEHSLVLGLFLPRENTDISWL